MLLITMAADRLQPRLTDVNAHCASSVILARLSTHNVKGCHSFVNLSQLHERAESVTKRLIAYNTALRIRRF